MVGLITVTLVLTHATAFVVGFYVAKRNPKVAAAAPNRLP